MTTVMSILLGLGLAALSFLMLTPHAPQRRGVWGLALAHLAAGAIAAQLLLKNVLR